MTKLLRAATAMAVVLFLPVAKAGAQTYSAAYVFGDSLSDPGNLARVVPASAPPPPYYGGRFSNGPVWTEQISPLLGGIPVTSYAFGGATSTASRPIDFLSQINAFLAGQSLSANGAAPTGKVTVGGSQLYSLWIGANDYFAYAQNPTTDPATYVAGVTANIRTGASELIQAGARTVLLLNLPNLGSTPLFQAQGVTAQTAANQLTAIHNADVLQVAQSLSATTPARVITVDINGVFSDVVANPAKYGFSNVTQSCILGGKSTGVCTASTIATQLFWDDVHPTTVGHTLIAQYIAGTLSTVIQGPQAIVATTQWAMQADQSFADAAQTRMLAARSGDGEIGLGDLGAATTGGRDGRVGLYLYGNYGNGQRDPVAGQLNYNYDRYTLDLGVDYRVTDHVLAGVALGYADTTGKIGTIYSDVDLQTVGLTGYLSAAFGNWYGDATLSYGFQNFKQFERRTGFSPNPLADSSPSGTTYGTTFKGGYNVNLGAFTVGPTAGLRYTNARINSYSETGAGSLGLNVSSFDAESLRGEAGVQASATTHAGRFTLVPQVQLTYSHEFMNDNRTLLALLPGGQTADTVAGAGGPNTLLAGGGLSVQSGNVTASVSYLGSVNDGDHREHSVMGHIRVGF